MLYLREVNILVSVMTMITVSKGSLENVVYFPVTLAAF